MQSANKMWNDPEIEKSVDIMDPEKKYRYQKVAENMFKRDQDDKDVVRFEAAAQVRLMLRDGLPPDMLEEDERQVFLEVFGPDALDDVDAI